jgi:cytochrome c nitrite reductase small subunit
MMSNDIKRPSFREKYLNKKVITIVIVAGIVLGSITAGGLLKASENPSFCGTCHIIKPYYESWNEGALLDHKHAQEDVECMDCHSRSIPEKVMEGMNFITGNYYMPLEGPPGDRTMCLECHSEDGEGASWEEIITATNFGESNPHDSHNGVQECYVCHSIHDTSTAFCADCHIFEWIDELDESWSS